MKRTGTNSLYILALRTLPNLKFSLVNFLIPLLVSGTLFFLGFNYFSDKKYLKELSDLLSTLLSFDGAILGLVLAGYGIFSSVEQNNRTLFAIINSPKDGKYSFFKMRLVTVFKMIFWIFNCTIAVFLSYLFLKGYEGYKIHFQWIDSRVKYGFLFAFIGWMQSKIFIELKIFIFSIYNRSLTEARMYAQEQGKKPFDEYID